MAEIRHNGGIVSAIIELGFDAVKYFEITATSSAQKLTISPPARRLILRNTSDNDAVYFNITGDDAAASVSSTPGDNIKIDAGCTFTMDFDTLTDISFITEGASVLVEGILGWKGTQC